MLIFPFFCVFFGQKTTSSKKADGGPKLETSSNERSFNLLHFGEKKSKKKWHQTRVISRDVNKVR